MTVFADVAVRLAAAIAQLHGSLLDMCIGLLLFFGFVDTSTCEAFEIDWDHFANDGDILCDGRMLSPATVVIARQTNFRTSRRASRLLHQ